MATGVVQDSGSIYVAINQADDANPYEFFVEDEGGGNIRLFQVVTTPEILLRASVDTFVFQAGSTFGVHRNASGNVCEFQLSGTTKATMQDDGLLRLNHDSDGGIVLPVVSTMPTGVEGLTVLYDRGSNQYMLRAYINSAWRDSDLFS